MKKIALFSIIILISCKNNNNDVTYPLNNLDIQRIHIKFNKDYVKSYDLSNDSLYLSKVSSCIDTIKSTSLIKAERIHATDYKGSVELISPENKILVIFNEHQDKGVIASFLMDKNGSNFQEFLGSLNNAAQLLELMFDKNI